MFRKEADLEAFERIKVEAHQRQPIRIRWYCVLSNHWQFVVWPEEDGQLTDFFRRHAHTHAMRWQLSHRAVAYGHLYQGRFKSFRVQSDHHLLSLLRHVERNPLSAGLVERAQMWRRGSLWSRVHGEEAIKTLLSRWPVDRPPNLTARVNSALTAKDSDRVGVRIARGRPYDGDEWVRQTVEELGSEQTVRPGAGHARRAGLRPIGTASCTLMPQTSSAKETNFDIAYVHRLSYRPRGQSNRVPVSVLQEGGRDRPRNACPGPSVVATCAYRPGVLSAGRQRPPRASVTARDVSNPRCGVID